LSGVGRSPWTCLVEGPGDPPHVGGSPAGCLQSHPAFRASSPAARPQNAGWREQVGGASSGRVSKRRICSVTPRPACPASLVSFWERPTAHCHPVGGVRASGSLGCSLDGGLATGCYRLHGVGLATGCHHLFGRRERGTGTSRNGLHLVSGESLLVAVSFFVRGTGFAQNARDGSTGARCRHHGVFPHHGPRPRWTGGTGNGRTRRHLPCRRSCVYGCFSEGPEGFVLSCP